MRIPIAILCVPAVAGILAAAPAAQDPWARVPKSPTACYSSQDKYNDEIGAAIDAVNQDIYKQQEINTQLNEKLNNLDPMEQASRMQTYMMENPEEVTRLMEWTQTGLPEGQAEAARESENEEALTAELKDIQSRYEAAFEKSLGPLYARLSALGISESSATPELTAQGMAIIKQINAAYEKACPEWWGATGHFHAWLKKYKDHLVNNRIPHRERGEAMKMTQFKVMGIPADAFRPTVAMETVVLYMNEALAIFEGREINPKTTPMIPK